MIDADAAVARLIAAGAKLGHAMKLSSVTSEWITVRCECGVAWTLSTVGPEDFRMFEDPAGCGLSADSIGPCRLAAAQAMPG